MAQKTHEKFMEEFIELYGKDKYTVLGRYQTNKIKLLTQCNTCGALKDSLPKNYLDKTRLSAICKICNPVKSSRDYSINEVTKESFLLRFEEVYGAEYTVIFNDKVEFAYNKKDSILVRHNTCGTVKLSTPNYWLNIKKNSCNKCANASRIEKIKKFQSTDDYLNKLTESEPEYRFLSEYSGNNKERHKIIHLACNTKYMVRPNDFQQGYRCPKCALNKKNSKASLEIEKWLEDLGVDFETEVRFEECKNIFPLPFDFAIYFQNQTFLIEYDGEQHFRSSGWNTPEKLEKTKSRDLMKNEFCKEANIPLFRINYKEDHITKMKEIMDAILYCRL